jgi:molybdopterin-binding protein
LRSRKASLRPSGQVVMAAITNESVEELKLTVGQTAYAVIKASDVMVGVD